MARERGKEQRLRKSSTGNPPVDGLNMYNEGTLSLEADAGQSNPFTQGSFEGANSFGDAKRRHNRKSEKPGKITHSDDITQDAEPQIGNAVAKESTLSHERPSILKQHRDRLSHKRASLAHVLPNTPKNRKLDYSKHMTYEGRTPAFVSEGEKSQNATFEHLSETSYLVHEDTTPPNYEPVSVDALTADAVSSSTEETMNVVNNSDSLAVGDEHSSSDTIANRSGGNVPDHASGESGRKKKGNKLRFDDEGHSSGTSASFDDAKPSEYTKSGKKLEKAEHRYKRSAEKLQTAKDNLPTKRVLRTNKEFDPELSKMKPSLRFEQEVKTQYEHLRGPAVVRPLRTGVNSVTGYAHKKIFQHEDENVGVRAAHKGELMAESGLRYAYRSHKLASYRRVQKLEERTRKLNVQASYRKALHENPKLKSNPIARMMQKRHIKREYAKTAQEAKRAGITIKKTATVTQRATTKLVMGVKSNPKVLAMLGLLFLMIVMIFGLVSSCSSIATSVGQSFTAITYLAEDECIDDASIFYSYLETDLRHQIINIEDDWPDIDELRMNIGSIGHCPFMLMAYLTAVHHDFTFAEIKDVLREIFEQQYTLEITEVVEERRRWEQVSWEPDEYDWVYYNWYVLYVTLTSKPFFDVINARMDNGQHQHYSLLMQSRGLRQIVMSPFDFYWMPFVSSHYGWRIHPITGGKQLHLGIDIALPTGTPILAATSGTVTFAGDMGGYGLVVFIDNGEGIVTVYAHCDTLLVSTGQTVEIGDIIATVGTTGDSTGPHLHFEIIRNGRHLNPVFFAFSNTF